MEATNEAKWRALEGRFVISKSPSGAKELLEGTKESNGLSEMRSLIFFYIKPIKKIELMARPEEDNFSFVAARYLKDNVSIKFYVCLMHWF